MADRLRVVLHTDAPDGLTARLHAAVPEAEVQLCTTYEDLPDLIAQFAPQIVYTVRFAGTPGYPRAALFGPRGPALVCNGGVGTDHFGLWDPERTTVTNAAGVAAGMMAEYVLGGFLHFTLDIPGLAADQAQRVWRARTVRPLAGATLLIVGLGQTGQALAARARAFGMHVIGTRARPAAMENVDEVHGPDQLDTLIPRADFVAVCTPLTDRTRAMIGPAQIAALRPRAVLADVSRGGVVDQTALARALAARAIGGAVLDVFEVEPLPQDSPFWDMDNVILSPHCASVYDGWETASFDIFVDNVTRWQAGADLRNVVDPVRGY
ncbi:D-2-hydroxyacid dehydrogenase [uncultured Tateyamaria sp.]|uniref:D-2-hydroxyacid dehydrogenase n=1 Tax=uncultured Tateyamaria sp. TaxID=455651 RepID=UPI00263228FA|nr:D-2-hydroxyacid dehydrogenase [uncultured Tateyamaria sp.]